MLEVRHISVHYDRMRALADVSIDVPPGRLIAIVGSNGAGKSTLLRAISGLVRPSHGSIDFDGRPIRSLAAHSIARLGIAHVPEGRGLLPGLTVAENLRLGAMGRADNALLEQDRAKVFDYFPALKNRLHDNASVLSGGEQQMLSIGRALLKAPRLLLIDEMSLGLAPKLVQQLMEVIVALVASGIGVLCVEQNTRLVLKHAYHAYVLETGRTVLEGPGAEIAGHDQVVHSYLGRSMESPHGQ